MARTRQYFPVERLLGYTDGVFAIAATLLVLDLTATGFDAVHSDSEMWAALGREWQSFVAFLVSFLLLSMLWLVHVQQFRDIARADSALMWLNNLRLLFIVLIPFTTSLNSSESDYVAGRVLLPTNFFLASLLGFFSYRWAAARGGHLLRDEAKPREADENLGGLAAALCGAVAVVLSPWFGSWAFLAYALNGPLEILLTRRYRRRHPSPPAPDGTGPRG